MRAREELRIGEVAARTGLSERMIRHYEKLGLAPVSRNSAGQRLFGVQELARLGAIQTLKRAGFGLAEIKRLFSGKADVETLVSAQLEALRAEQASLQTSIDLLQDIADDMAAGCRLNAASLVEVLAAGDARPSRERLRAFLEKHFTKEDHKVWIDLQEKLSQEVDPASYNRLWAELGGDIKAALPLDPSSARAQALLDRWDALLEPFNTVANERQKEQARITWSHVGEWAADDQPVNQAVVDFIIAARQVREAADNRNESTET